MPYGMISSASALFASTSNKTPIKWRRSCVSCLGARWTADRMLIEEGGKMIENGRAQSHIKGELYITHVYLNGQNCFVEVNFIHNHIKYTDCHLFEYTRIANVTFSPIPATT